MIRYMLDTNICIYLIRRKPSRVLRRLHQVPPTDVAISSITLSELEFGVCKSARPRQNRVALIGFLASFEVMPYDDRAAEQYGWQASAGSAAGSRYSAPVRPAAIALVPTWAPGPARAGTARPSGCDC